LSSPLETIITLGLEFVKPLFSNSTLEIRVELEVCLTLLLEADYRIGRVLGIAVLGGTHLAENGGDSLIGQLSIIEHLENLGDSEHLIRLSLENVQNLLLELHILGLSGSQLLGAVFLVEQLNLVVDELNQHGIALNIGQGQQSGKLLTLGHLHINISHSINSFLLFKRWLLLITFRL